MVNGRQQGLTVRYRRLREYRFGDIRGYRQMRVLLIEDEPTTAKAIELMGGADYKKFVKAAAEANPMADVEVTERALVHREVAFSKQVVETGQDM